MKTNKGLSEHAKKVARENWPYCYGTYCKEFTESVLSNKAVQYPEHYTPDRMAKYREWAKARRRTADCVGMIKGYMWEREDGSIGYGINGCPDKSANGLYENAKVKGDIKTMPLKEGICLHMNGHTGVYVGNGMVSEERGFKFGGVFTRLSERPWLHWYEAPGAEYEEADVTEEQSHASTLGLRTLKRGCAGEDVETLQKLLIGLGYALPRYGADGDYGTETVSAVAAFQQEHGLEVDGIYGKMSHAALMAAIGYDDDDDAEQAKLPDKWIEVVGGTVNVRKGAGTAYAVITVVRKGERLRVVGEADGWHAVIIGDETGWISQKYTAVSC